MKKLLARLGLWRRKKSVFLSDQFPQFQIGRGSYGDLRVRSWGEGTTLKMGAFCSVASGVKVFLGGEHRTDWVSTYPFTEFWPDATKNASGHPRSRGDVVIGNDVWIGTEALIMSGVCIGNGAVVGARAVVTKDIPPYAIVVGNPAKVSRMRFPPSVVDRLEKLAWWDWNDRKIAESMPMLLSDEIEKFLLAAESAG